MTELNKPTLHIRTHMVGFSALCKWFDVPYDKCKLIVIEHATRPEVQDMFPAWHFNVIDRTFTKRGELDRYRICSSDIDGHDPISMRDYLNKHFDWPVHRIAYNVEVQTFTFGDGAELMMFSARRTFNKYSRVRDLKGVENFVSLRTEFIPMKLKSQVRKVKTSFPALETIDMGQVISFSSDTPSHTTSVLRDLVVSIMVNNPNFAEKTLNAPMCIKSLDSSGYEKLRQAAEANLPEDGNVGWTVIRDHLHYSKATFDETWSLIYGPRVMVVDDINVAAMLAYPKITDQTDAMSQFMTMLRKRAYDTDSLILTGHTAETINILPYGDINFTVRADRQGEDIALSLVNMYMYT